MKIRYLGFFYVDTNSFEIRSEVGEGDICFAKRNLLSSDTRRAKHDVAEVDYVGVCYGSEVGRFYRTFRFGDLVYIAQRCANSDGRILELSKYIYLSFYRLF